MPRRQQEPGHQVQSYLSGLHRMIGAPHSKGFTSKSPWRFGCDFKCINFKHNMEIESVNIWVNITMEWMPEYIVDSKPTVVQVMAWCREATSHYLNQCWPQFPTPYGVTRPQWVKIKTPSPITNLVLWHVLMLGLRACQFHVSMTVGIYVCNYSSGEVNRGLFCK